MGVWARPIFFTYPAALGNMTILTGTNANDTLSGGAGSQTLIGGLGDDSLDGGDGVDTADYSDKTASVFASLVTLTAQVLEGHVVVEADQLSGIENITGGTGNDTLTGDAADNVLNGGSGIDVMFGGAGADTLSGGNGSDVYLIASAAEHGIGEVIADTGNGVGDVDEIRYAATAVGTLVLQNTTFGIERVVIGTGAGPTAITTGKAALGVDASAVTGP